MPAVDLMGEDRVILNLIGAILFAGVRPRSTHVRLLDAPRSFALWVHLLGLLLAGAVLLIPEWPFLGLVGGLRHELNREILRPGTDQWIWVLVVLVITEAVHWLFALMLVAWGSWQARLRDVWRHSLRVVWVFTPQVAWNILILGIVDVLFDALRPLPISRYDGEFTTATFAVLTLASIASMLRAVTAPLLAEQTDLPLVCDRCGYNLSHQPPESDCPECGTPVALSSDPALRSADVFSTSDGALRKYVRCHVGAWVFPDWFFRGMATTRGLRGAGLFLMVNMALSAVGLAAGFLIPLVYFERDFVSRGGFVVLFVCGGMGGVAALMQASLASLTAAVPGMLISRRHGRNRVGACMVVACYCSGLFPIWSTTFAATAAVATRFFTLELGLEGWWTMRVALAMMWGSQVAFTILYIVTVLRRLGYTVHANR